MVSRQALIMALQADQSSKRNSIETLFSDYGVILTQRQVPASPQYLCVSLQIKEGAGHVDIDEA